MQKMIKPWMDKAHNDFDYLVASFVDTTLVLKQPLLFSNRVCIHAALMGMVKDHIDAGVLAAFNFRSSIYSGDWRTCEARTLD